MPLPPASEVWIRAHRDEMGRLGAALEAIVDAVERNDMAFFGESPQRCVESATVLAAASAGVLDGEQQTSFGEMARACGRLSGPASLNDAAGVQTALEPLFLSAGPLTPLLQAAGALS